MRIDKCAVELSTIRKATVHTILIMHLLNLKQIFPFLDNIVIQFVPTCCCSKLRAWELCYRRDQEAINYEAKNIERAYANEGDSSTQAGIFGQIELHERQTIGILGRKKSRGAWVNGGLKASIRLND